MNPAAPPSAPVLRREIVVRNPFHPVSVPFLAALHAAAYKPERGVSKLFVAKPAKALFRTLMRLGMGGAGRFRLDLPGGSRDASFRARNTQFGAIYQPHFRPGYEPEVSALLDLLVPDDGCFLDIGANWGWFSLLVASRPGFRGRIHAFEPMPETFADLAGVVRGMGLEGRIVCHAVALSDREGSDRMAIPGDLKSGSARLDRNGGTVIRLNTLDRMALPPASVIKMDVEDHEAEVLRGAEASIAEGRPFVVFENWLIRARPAATLAPLAWFRERDYRFYHAGWETETAGCVVPSLPRRADGRSVLAVVPFPLEQRFHLPGQLNVLAAPAERLDELRRRVEGAG